MATRLLAALPERVEAVGRLEVERATLRASLPPTGIFFIQEKKKRRKKRRRRKKTHKETELSNFEKKKKRPTNSKKESAAVALALGRRGLRFERLCFEKERNE